ncbi:hypothetical protein [Paenibacillus macerans]|nr:hypothetical protein [Paenibacillus macerans]
MLKAKSAAGRALGNAEMGAAGAAGGLGLAGKWKSFFTDEHGVPKLGDGKLKTGSLKSLEQAAEAFEEILEGLSLSLQGWMSGMGGRRLGFEGNGGGGLGRHFEVEYNNDYRKHHGGGGDERERRKGSDERIEKVGSHNKLTEPSLPKGSKVTDQELKLFDSKRKDPGYEREVDTFKLLKAEGYDITPLKEIPGGNGWGIAPQSNPDFIIEGNVFDCYSPQGILSDNKVREIYKKTKKQANRIILNLDDFNVDDIGDLKQGILRKANPNGDLKNLKELLVVKDGKITRWFWKGD